MRVAPRIAAALALLSLVLAGCSDKIRTVAGPANRPPTVELTGRPSATTGSYAYHLSWIGHDSDGRVDHYLVSRDVRSLAAEPRAWARATETKRILESHRPIGIETLAEDGPEIFAVKAVDDGGAVSEPATIAFFGANVAPSVRITSPLPSALTNPLVPPQIRIRWQGNDPDGADPNRLVRYVYRLFGPNDPDFPPDLIASNPDSLRRYYAPDFAGWESVPGDSLGVTYQALVPGQSYVFAITGFDAAGDYDPIFNLNTNVLRFRVGFDGLGGPILTLYNNVFTHTYPPGVILDPMHEFRVSTPAGRPLTVSWFAQPPYGAELNAYRWSIDIDDILDETPRIDRGDTEHWSAWSLTETSARLDLRRYQAGESHRLYVEARDSFGFVSLAVLRIDIFDAPLNRDLLIVDDTRLRPDMRLGGGIDKPKGPWPTAAELDSFLFARGGYPWREYPAGTLSSPGLFTGYCYDTLGTRTGQADLTVPLEVLVQYRHVVWIVDAQGALMSQPGDSPSSPMTALRYMTAPGRTNTLVTYAQAGGKLWIVGGGAGYASTIEWNSTANDFPTTTFSALLGELAPGRFMYDLPHWRSEFRTASSSLSLRRSAPVRRHRYGSHGYSLLPEQLEFKSAATDPLPPLRTNPGDFYRSVAAVEFLSQPNEIVEHHRRSTRTQITDPVLEHGRRSARPRDFAVLDSLYEATGGSLPYPPEHPHNVVMTRYHGAANGGTVFTGFDLWTWRRSQCQQLVDGVLRGMWGLSRAPAPAPVVLRPTDEPPVVIAKRR